ncbi:MAG: histidinol-phosphate aminotransferase family protein [Candidatus Eisenbacteria bacterium]|uniref:Histidinol-phosphate aminotransferase family protein n=1 Tax=Eiseniibacteriota bacterium TaxID=2212470 RepID=A0A538U0F4_UNCEI|nr:MAG: histidinol-phosphate aminotransferase family protein [Candidatus Eisenbacteria bacterium]
MTPRPPIAAAAATTAPAVLDLSDNTNLYGAPPAALRILREAAPDDATRYPSAYSDALRAALARSLGATPDQVTTGCGSDDVLDSAIRTFAAPGERIAFCDPTFSMIPVLAERNRLVQAPVPFTAGHDLDAEALLATGAPVIYLCSPNNPTGTAASGEAIARVLGGASGVVLMDEAYADFAAANVLGEATRRENLLVVRTLSKAFGLAGMRVGYGVGAPALIARVETARGPYKVGAAAERAATGVLTEDLEWVRERARLAVGDRARLIAALTVAGLRPLPSAANFVLVPVADAEACARRMLEAGVAVRAFAGLSGIGDAVRITVGPEPCGTRAVAALEEALA